MSIDDLRLALSWAADEGWNPGLDDAEPFLAANPEGFLMGWLDAEPAVSIAAVAYGEAYGFIGLYICRPDLRGRAIGARLVRAALDRLSDRPVGIDGVLARVANYERLGFTLAHRNLRYGGSIEPITAPDLRVRTIDAELAPSVAAFDAVMFGCLRRDFIRAWLTPTPRRSGAALVSDGEVTGYGVVRDCVSGHKIGPLFARSLDDANVILRSLSALRPGGTFFLDVPAPNAEGVELAHRHGMSKVFETARMYRGGEWNLPLAQTFGITTFELG
ncbi:MAG: GNAT family N-acetyltransferase [Alphaproteobacteria bacterium]